MVTNETKVLVVDDFELIRNIVIKSLKDIGFTRFEQATNGQEAIEKLEKEASGDDPFGLVFLDWNMPIKSGLDVLKFCRGSKGLEDMPIIMVTAESEKKEVLMAFSHGVNDYIVKPCSPLIVQKKVQSLIESLKKKAG